MRLLVIVALLASLAQTARADTGAPLLRLDREIETLLQQGRGEEVEALASSLSDPFLVDYVRIRLAVFQGTLGRQRALGLAESLISTRREPSVLGLLGQRLADLHEKLGNYVRMAGALQASLSAYEATGDQRNQLRTQLRLARALTSHSLAPEKARTHYLTAAHLARLLGDQDAEHRVEQGLAEWSERASKARDLTSAYRGAVDGFAFRESLPPHGGRLLDGADGFLYVLRQGLARFDGSFLQALPIGEEPIDDCTMVTPTGRPACVTESGVHLAAADGWTPLPDTDGATVVAADGRDGLWLDRGSAAVHWSQGATRQVRTLPSVANGAPKVMGFTVTRDGRVVTVSSAGVEVRQGASTTLLQDAPQMPKDPRRAIEDSDGSLWILASDGAVRLNRDLEVMQRVNPEPRTGSPSVRSLQRAADGRLWMGLGRGVGVWDGDTLGVVHAQGDLFEQVFAIAEWGPQGSLWLLNKLGQLVRLALPTFEVFDRTLLPSSSIHRILPQDDGTLLLATGHGAARFDPKTLEVLSFDDDDHCVGTIEEMLQWGESQWLGVSEKDDCVFVRQGDRIRSSRQGKGLSGAAVGSSTALFNGAPCLATSSGIRCLLSEPGSVGWWTPLSLMPFSQKRFHLPHCLAATPKGGLLISVPGEGVFHAPADGTPATPFQGGKLTPPVHLLDTGSGVLLAGPNGLFAYREGDIEPVPGVPGVPTATDFQSGIRLHDGLLLLGTVNGGRLVLSDGEDWLRLGIEDGLPTLYINDFLQDEQGDVWIATEGSGLARMRWDRSALPETFIVAKGQAYFVDRHGKSRRLAVVSLREPGAGMPPKVRARAEGHTLLESSAGLFSIPSTQALPPHVSPAAARATAGGAPSVLTRLAQQDSVDPAPYGDDRLTFRLAAITPYRALSPGQHLYRYRLDGEPWSGLRESTRLVLENVAAGRHTLEVRAKGYLLAADPTSAVLEFTVDKPLPVWRWFFPVGLVALVGAWQRKRLRTAYLWTRYSRGFKPIDDVSFDFCQPAWAAPLLGRGQVVDTLVKASRTGSSAVVLWGERGAGKTAVLRAVDGQLTGTTEVVVYRDLAVAMAGGDLGRLLTSLSTGLVAAMAAETTARVLLPPGQRDRLKPGQLRDMESGEMEAFLVEQALAEHNLTPNSQGEGKSGSDTGDGVAGLRTPLSTNALLMESNPFTRLDRTLRRLERNRPDSRVVFLLDNAEVLALALESDAAYGSYLFHFLRSTVQQRSSVCFFLAMSGRWFDLCHNFDQLFSFATPVRIGRLKPEASAQLLTTALRGKALLPPKALDQLTALTGGQAHLLRLLGQRLVEVMNQRKINVCTPEVAQAVAEAMLEDPELRFEASWTELERDEKLLMAALCQAGESESGESMSALLARLAAGGGKMLPEEARRAVTALTKSQLVESTQSGMYVRGELWRQWVAQNYSVSGVLEEAYDYVGQYQLIQRLGAGGMGVVYKARDMVGGGTVAVKLLRPELAENKRGRSRFSREARLGRQLDHPNIVRILDYGEQGGRLYLTMEYLDGTTLTSWARANRADASIVAEIGMHLASALAAIHRRSILHRDIKGDNVMLQVNSDGTVDAASVKLMDFGLAVGDEASRMTLAGSVLGTVAYMSPEQAKGEQLDQRSDLYGLGAVLYELACGRPPFEGAEVAQVLHAVVHEQPQPIRSRVPTLPIELAEIIDSLLCKSPEARPSGAHLVDDRLRVLLHWLEPAETTGLLHTVDHVMSAPYDTLAQGSGLRSSGLASRSLESLRAEGSMLPAWVSSSGGPTSASRISLSDSHARLPLGELLILHRLSAAVARGNDQASLFDEFLDQVLGTLRCRRGLVLLAHDRDLHCEAALGADAEALEQKVQEVKQLAQRSIDEQTGFLAMPDPERALGPLLCAPLWAGEHVFGAAIVEREPSGAVFGDADLEFLTSVGYLWGLAIERDRLRADQDLAVIGRMLAGVAHDLRNPMAVISGYAQLVPLEREEAGRRDGCKRILIQLDVMTAMIGDLLAFARGDSTLQAQLMEVERFAQEVRDGLRQPCEARKIQLLVEAKGGEVRVDQGRARRILFNLASNAVDVLTQGQTLRVRLAVENEGLSMQVQDDGPGIPSELRSRIFDPFVTDGKANGTGLGLAIVKRFVNDHGGTITLEGGTEGGTTFKVWLPSCVGT